MDMAALQERVTELTAVLRGLQLQVQQAVEAVENLGAHLAEAAVVVEWTELAPEPVAELAPEPVAAVAQPAQLSEGALHCSEACPWLSAWGDKVLYSLD